jgi:ArsR family transcriptional regulator
VEEILATFKALSDETRLKILKLLEQGELCVCDLVAALDMIQPRVSFHLGILKKARLVKDRKEGKWMHYRIDDSDLMKRFLLLSALEQISDDSVGDDRERLARFLDTKNQPCSDKAASNRCYR